MEPSDLKSCSTKRTHRSSAEFTQRTNDQPMPAPLTFYMLEDKSDVAICQLVLCNISEVSLNFKIKCIPGGNIVAAPVGNAHIAPHSQFRLRLTWTKVDDLANWDELDAPKLLLITNFMDENDEEGESVTQTRLEAKISLAEKWNEINAPVEQLLLDAVGKSTVVFSPNTIRVSNELIQVKKRGLLRELSSKVLQVLNEKYNKNRFGGFVSLIDYKDHFELKECKLALLKQKNPVQKDCINLIRMSRKRRKGPGHAVTAFYNSSTRRVTIYDSATDRRLLPQYRQQLLAYHAHKEDDSIKVAVSPTYNKQNMDYECAYHALFSVVLLLDKKKPQHYIMNQEAVWRMCKVASENPAQMPDSIGELADMVAVPKQEKEKARVRYNTVKRSYIPPASGMAATKDLLNESDRKKLGALRHAEDSEDSEGSEDFEEDSEYSEYSESSED